VEGRRAKGRRVEAGGARVERGWRRGRPAWAEIGRRGALMDVQRAISRLMAAVTEGAESASLECDLGGGLEMAGASCG